MKKIYLEKQFMKATNNNGYIIGEIFAEGKGFYEIKKQDGGILTVFSHAILGWEDYNEEKRGEQKAFTPSQLERLIYSGEKLEGKTIYALDTCRCSNGTNMTGLTVAHLTDKETVIEFYDILHGKHKFVADIVIDMVKNQNQSNVEIHLDATGLGMGLVDYLKEAPCKVVIHEISVLNQAHAKLIEKVEKEEIKFQCNLFGTPTIDLLNDLEIIVYSNGKVRLQPYYKDENKKILLGSLLVVMCADKK